MSLIPATIPRLKQLWLVQIPSPLGDLIAVADNNFLYLLNFADNKHLRQSLNSLANIWQSEIKTCNDKVLTSHPILQQTQIELAQYFAGTRKIFKTPTNPLGTIFQRRVWLSLQKIPYGEKISYAKQAEILNHPKAVRAVAQANCRNPILIIIPCHRVIGSNGKLTGYTAGIARKAALLRLESGLIESYSKNS